MIIGRLVGIALFVYRDYIYAGTSAIFKTSGKTFGVKQKLISLLRNSAMEIFASLMSLVLQHNHIF